MAFYIYILKCNDNSLYTGHTENLNKRIHEHNNKKYAGYTSTRLPVVLVYSEAFSSRNEALTAEQKIKTWSRKKKNALISNGWQGIINLRKKRI
jgi:predicted GIY-YIG superfamily endonuclease